MINPFHKNSHAWKPMGSAVGGNACPPLGGPPFYQITSCFGNKRQAAISGTFTNSCAIQCTDTKASGTPSSKNKTFFSMEFDLVEESESLDHVCSLITFSDSSRKNLQLMDLPVMAAHLLQCEPFAGRDGISVPADTSCVCTMCLLNVIFLPPVCCDIAKCHRTFP